MRLSDFISETMAEISKGVRQAQKMGPNGWVAPARVDDELVWAVKEVKFDVAVTKLTGGDGGISVAGVANVAAEKRQEEVNRIAFSVPVYFEALGGTD